MVLMEGGSLQMGGTSRMSREAQVRICERLGVKFPGPTRRSGLLVAEKQFRRVQGHKQIPALIKAFGRSDEGLE